MCTMNVHANTKHLHLAFACMIVYRKIKGRKEINLGRSSLMSLLAGDISGFSNVIIARFTVFIYPLKRY